MLTTGEKLEAGYTLARLLGKGSHGEVWRAVAANGREAALKFLPCSHSSFAGRELRALHLVRQLKHRSLIRTDNIWAEAGYIVVAMELADGNLLDLLEVYYDECQQGINPEDLCSFLEPAAAALDFLNARQHRANGGIFAIRHGDVKPSNLLLVGQEVRLADFGLSTITTLTSCRQHRFGTLSYAAPEVFQGWLSERSDQYALAATYCQLRGGLPFDDTPTTFDPRYVRPAPDLSMLRPEERPIIARGLAPAPQDRWPSCVEMIDQLVTERRRVIAHELQAVPAAPESGAVPATAATSATAASA